MIEQNVPLRVDVVSDVMCPWCVIGYRQLACALDTMGVDQLRDCGIYVVCRCAGAGGGFAKHMKMR